MPDGWFFIFFAFLLAYVAVAPQTGRLRRNYVVGLRVGPLMRSERAWRTGHRGAARVLIPTAAVLVGYGICMIMEWPSWIVNVHLDLLRVIGIVITLGGLVWGTIRGVRVATEVESKADG